MEYQKYAIFKHDIVSHEYMIVLESEEGEHVYKRSFCKRLEFSDSNVAHNHTYIGTVCFRDGDENEMFIEINNDTTTETLASFRYAGTFEKSDSLAIQAFHLFVIMYNQSS